MIERSVFLSALIILAQTSTQQYPIKLDPIEKAGDRYRLDAASTTTTTIKATVAGQFLRSNEDSFKVQLSADVTIVDATNNWATRKRFIVLRSSLTQAGTTRALLPEGTVVVASLVDGKSVYHINEKVMGEDISTFFRPIINLRTARVADDEMFGSSSPKRIGETWPISIDAMRKLLKEMGVKGGRQEISGTSTLDKVEANHLFIRSSINVQDVLLPMSPQVTPEGGEIRTEYAARIPIAESDPTRETVGSLYMSLVGSVTGDDGKKVKVQYVFESHSRFLMYPIPSASTAP